ncbi:MAG: MerR family transcriptional regulator [Croceibacterium sp.]
MSEDASPPLFLDGKDPMALRTIGEIGAALGIKQHVLRYWEQQFPMLRPLKRSGGRRYYRPEDVALVATLDRLINREGYTLKGARQAVERGAAHVSGAALPPASAVPLAPPSGVPRDLLPKLRAIREQLAAALAV